MVDCGCNALAISQEICEKLKLKTFKQNAPPRKNIVGKILNNKSIVMDFFELEFNEHKTWETTKVQKNLNHDIFISSGYLATHGAKRIVSGNLGFKCKWKDCYSKQSSNTSSLFEITYDESVVYDPKAVTIEAMFRAQKRNIREITKNIPELQK